MMNPIAQQTAVQLRRDLENGWVIDDSVIHTLIRDLGGNPYLAQNATRDGQLLYLILLLMT